MNTSELPNILRETNVVFVDRVEVALLSVMPGGDRNMMLGLAAWNLTKIARTAADTGGALVAKYNEDANKWTFTLVNRPLSPLGETVIYDGMHASVANWDRFF